MKPDQTKALQMGFLLLLVVSFAQVAWWVFENAHHSNKTAERLLGLHEASAQAVTAALDGGSARQVDQALPGITVDPENRIAIINPETALAIRQEAHSRTNRFYWEGGFFLLVLVVAMAGLAATIRRDRQLRRRQQNFLASVSHEFKSPLASIQLAAETLNRRSDDTQITRWGSRILIDCERLLRTVDNLLSTNRLDEGTHLALPETVVLAAVIASIQDEFSERMEHYGIDFTSAADNSVTVHADVVALETIIRNLVDNALKACIAGNSNKVHVAILVARNDVSITVTDNGVGFDSNDAKMLFEKFYRVGDEQQRTTPGTGLGLYIVERLAKLSGATVTAASDGPGLGAAITVKWGQ